MWWKLGLLVLAAVLVWLVVAIPIATVRIQVNLPHGPWKPAPRQGHDGAAVVVWFNEVVITGAVLLIAGLIGRRIVRHHRRSS